MAVNLSGECEQTWVLSDLPSHIPTNAYVRVCNVVNSSAHYLTLSSCVSVFLSVAFLSQFGVIFSHSLSPTPTTAPHPLPPLPLTHSHHSPSPTPTTAPHPLPPLPLTHSHHSPSPTPTTPLTHPYSTPFQEDCKKHQVQHFITPLGLTLASQSRPFPSCRWLAEWANSISQHWPHRRTMQVCTQVTHTECLTYICEHSYS